MNLPIDVDIINGRWSDSLDQAYSLGTTLLNTMQSQNIIAKLPFVGGSLLCGSRCV